MLSSEKDSNRQKRGSRRAESDVRAVSAVPIKNDMAANRQRVLNLVETHLSEYSNNLANLCLSEQEQIWLHTYQNIIDQTKYNDAQKSIRQRLKGSSF